MTAHTRDVLAEVYQERLNQDRTFGAQNHPSGACTRLQFIAECARRDCDDATIKGEVTWYQIALEEFFEAFSEVDTVKRRAELVQLAAVVVNAIEAEDRRKGEAVIRLVKPDAQLAEGGAA